MWGEHSCPGITGWACAPLTPVTGNFLISCYFFLAPLQLDVAPAAAAMQVVTCHWRTRNKTIMRPVFERTCRMWSSWASSFSDEFTLSTVEGGRNF